MLLDYQEKQAGPPLVLRSGATVDLHMHSPASDGFWTPDNLPQAAVEKGIKVLALTDHDEIAGIPAMAEACRVHDIHLIPAAEFSVMFGETLFHMLAYNFDLSNERLQSKMAEVRQYYEDMVNNAIAELAKQGKPLDPAKSPGLLNRPLKVYHLVAALIENGYAKNMYDAYSICKTVGAQSNWTPPMEETIDLVHQAGGVTVIAHPGRAEPGFTVATGPVLDGMRAIGLDGVEVFHSFHTPADIGFYLTYAEETNMLIGCGSDTHGPGQSRRMLTAWPATSCWKLLNACGISVHADF